MRKTKNNYVPAEYGGYLFPKSCLPDILPGDRGKVLTVNESETAAEWAEGSGGSGIFWITTTEVEQGDETFLITLDKTFLEIYTAMQNRLLCVIIYSSNQDDPPTRYAARHGVVKEIYYNSSDGAVVEADMTFTCSSVNDYPEASD